MISQSPVYNLKAVLKETGLKADVLRAWERRYELPQPHRTPGGHRLYSEYDIETLKWLKARQAEGLSISRAVELWKEIAESGLDPLVKYSPLHSLSAPDQPPLADVRVDTLRQHWLDANLAFDVIRADEVLNQAFSIYPVETVCSEILQKGISEIGTYWFMDKATVQQEHFATAQASRRLETLITATPRPTRKQSVLIGCPPGEHHTFSVLLLSLLLQRRGLQVVYLGANVPLGKMKETAASIQPNLIILAAQQLTTAASLQSVALALQGFPLAYGGLIFNRIPELRDLIPAHFLGEALEEAVQKVEHILVTPTPTTFIIKVDKAYRELADAYREKRPLVENAVLTKLHQDNWDTDFIAEANFFFGNSLSAALDLGNPAFLDADLEWVKKLLTGRQVTVDSLAPYLTAYSRFLQRELGEASAPVTGWAASYLARSQVAHS